MPVPHRRAGRPQSSSSATEHWDSKRSEQEVRIFGRACFTSPGPPSSLWLEIERCDREAGVLSADERSTDDPGAGGVLRQAVRRVFTAPFCVEDFA